MKHRSPKGMQFVMRRPPLIILAFTCLASLAGCDDNGVITPQEPDTVRVSFQDGVLPTASYQGTADAVLKNGPTNEMRNGNFGAAPSDTIGSLPLPSDPFERRLIIRMNLSSVTNCLQVISARLTIHLSPGAHTGMKLNAHEVTLLDSAPWSEGTGGVGAGVSWMTIDGAELWTIEGGDFNGTAMDERTAAGDTLTFSLGPALVREWIADPASNHGVIIKAADASQELAEIVLLSEYPTAAMRPRLDVTYLKGG